MPTCHCVVAGYSRVGFSCIGDRKIISLSAGDAPALRRPFRYCLRSDPSALRKRSRLWRQRGKMSAKNEDGLEFSEFDLSGRADNAAPAVTAETEYHPIATIVKLDSFEIDFEPDEETGAPAARSFFEEDEEEAPPAPSGRIAASPPRTPPQNTPARAATPNNLWQDLDVPADDEPSGTDAQRPAATRSVTPEAHALLTADTEGTEVLLTQNAVGATPSGKRTSSRLGPRSDDAAAGAPAARPARTDEDAAATITDSDEEGEPGEGDYGGMLADLLRTKKKKPDTAERMAHGPAKISPASGARPESEDEGFDLMQETLAEAGIPSAAEDADETDDDEDATLAEMIAQAQDSGRPRKKRQRKPERPERVPLELTGRRVKSPFDGAEGTRRAVESGDENEFGDESRAKIAAEKDFPELGALGLPGLDDGSISDLLSSEEPPHPDSGLAVDMPELNEESTPARGKTKAPLEDLSSEFNDFDFAALAKGSIGESDLLTGVGDMLAVNDLPPEVPADIAEEEEEDHESAGSIIEEEEEDNWFAGSSGSLLHTDDAEFASTLSLGNLGTDEEGGTDRLYDEFSDSFAEEDEERRRNRLPPAGERFVRRMQELREKIPAVSELTEATRAWLALLRSLKGTLKQEGLTKGTKSWLRRLRELVGLGDSLFSFRGGGSPSTAAPDARKKDIIAFGASSPDIVGESGQADWGAVPAGSATDESGQEGGEDFSGWGSADVSSAPKEEDESELPDSGWGAPNAAEPEAEAEQAEPDGDMPPEDFLPDEEDYSFSTADMLMQDNELGLNNLESEFDISSEEDDGGSGEPGMETPKREKEDLSRAGGRLRQLQKRAQKWGSLLYKHLDKYIDFENNWWKLVDFLALIILTMAAAAFLSYFLYYAK